MSLPQDFDLKERVRSSVDIVDVIGATLELQPQGRNLVARCPWHNDRRPSMTINQERQTWKCWPCDIGGDVFSFVMRRDGVDFPTAIRTLAELAGIPIEEYRRGKQTKPGSPDDKATLLAAMKLVSDAYYDYLQGDAADAKLARDYLAARGINDESRERFRIGFSPDEWSFAVDLLKKHDFSGEVAHASGVASAKRSGTGFVDMFRGRLMFPIHDLQDRPIALGGRVIPAIAERHGDRAGGKYINGRETLLFRKSHQLYGLQVAREAIRRSGEVMVMEGYTDVVACRQSGVEPVVAVLGTALGEQHVKILRRFAERVVLVLDGDAAGQNRADEVLELFVRAEVDLRVLTLPEGSDPADYVSEHGRESFEKLVQEAPDALDHKLSRLTQGVDFTRDTHAVTSAVDTMLKIVAKAPDGLRIDQLLNRMSKRFEFKVERLERRLEVLREEARRRATRRPSGPSSGGGQRQISRPRSSDTQQVAAGRSGDPNDAFMESADSEQSTFEDVIGGGSQAPSASVAGAEAPLSLTPMTGLDRDLFETLIESPELAAMAVEAIDPSWFDSMAAKMLLSAYQDLDLNGHSLDIDSVLLLVENESLKSQIVTLQERVRDHAGKLPLKPEDRYAAIMNRYRERAFAAEQSKQIEQLASASMDEEDEVALLQALIDETRNRHGIKK
ncbi:MAG: DNA primase [Rubripirellula sp.]